MPSITYFGRGKFFLAYHNGSRWLWESQQEITEAEYRLANNLDLNVSLLGGN
jgi:hypothetical protein